MDIKRRDVSLLLDHIEDNHGAQQANQVLRAVISPMASWYQTRDDTYVSPVVKGMMRTTNASRARILDDDEIRAVWKAANESGAFGGVVQLALLTAQRIDKLMTMRWSDISPDWL